MCAVVSVAEGGHRTDEDPLAAMQALQEWGDRWGREAIGTTIISMTHCPADVLWVLWLAQQIAAWRGAGTPATDIVPLFETIHDLECAADHLDALFRHPVYRRHLEQRGLRWCVMVGYSDSAKDGNDLAVERVELQVRNATKGKVVV